MSFLKKFIKHLIYIVSMLLCIFSSLFAYDRYVVSKKRDIDILSNKTIYINTEKRISKIEGNIDVLLNKVNKIDIPNRNSLLLGSMMNILNLIDQRSINGCLEKDSFLSDMNTLYLKINGLDEPFRSTIRNKILDVIKRAESIEDNKKYVLEKISNIEKITNEIDISKGEDINKKNSQEANNSIVDRIKDISKRAFNKLVTIKKNNELVKEEYILYDMKNIAKTEIQLIRIATIEHNQQMYSNSIDSFVSTLNRYLNNEKNLSRIQEIKREIDDIRSKSIICRIPIEFKDLENMIMSTYQTVDTGSSQQK